MYLRVYVCVYVKWGNETMDISLPIYLYTYIYLYIYIYICMYIISTTIMSIHDILDFITSEAAIVIVM